jgi:hypothetical protein
MDAADLHNMHPAGHFGLGHLGKRVEFFLQLSRGPS